MISSLMAGSCCITRLSVCKMIGAVSVDCFGCNFFLCLKIFLLRVRPPMLGAIQYLHGYALKKCFENQHKKDEHVFPP